MAKHVGRFELVERGQHGGAAQRRGAPGVGAFAVVHVGEQIGPAHGGIDRHAVAQALAQHDDVGLDAIVREGVQRAGAAEVGLHLVEDEDDVVLAAELFEQLQVFLLRMIRAAAAQVRLGDQAADPAAILGGQRGQLVFDTASRSSGWRRRATLWHSSRRKADEAHARIALGILLAAGHGAGQALLAVKAVRAWPG